MTIQLKNLYEVFWMNNPQLDNMSKEVAKNNSILLFVQMLAFIINYFYMRFFPSTISGFSFNIEYRFLIIEGLLIIAYCYYLFKKNLIVQTFFGLLGYYILSFLIIFLFVAILSSLFGMIMFVTLGFPVIFIIFILTTVSYWKQKMKN